MQAPAVGRGLSELLLHGRYQTLDLSRLGYRHCQLKQAWYASSVGGAVAQCGEVLGLPIGLTSSQPRGAGKLTSTPLS
jgi:hypothetical protein